MLAFLLPSCCHVALALQTPLIAFRRTGKNQKELEAEAALAVKQALAGAMTVHTVGVLEDKLRAVLS